MMLARQMGLTRSQVSNWFINARVRLWKPMVEEMYKEEAGDAEMDSNSSSDVVTKATNRDLKISEDRGEDVQNSATSTAVMKCSTGQFSASKLVMFVMWKWSDPALNQFSIFLMVEKTKLTTR